MLLSLACLCLFIIVIAPHTIFFSFVSFLSVYNLHIPLLQLSTGAGQHGLLGRRGLLPWLIAEFLTPTTELAHALAPNPRAVARPV